MRHSFDWASMAKLLEKIVLIMLLLSMIVPFIHVQAQPGVPLKDKFVKQANQNTVEDSSLQEQQNNYARIMQIYEDNGYQGTKNIEIKLNPKDAVGLSEKDVVIEYGVGDSKEAALIWEEEAPFFEWSINVPEAGLYEIYFDYYPLKGSGSVIQRELMIDGEVPFDEASNISFYRLWKDEGQPIINSLGDEVRPRQVEVTTWTSTAAWDIKGLYTEPLKFYFSEGQHVLRINYVDQPIAIGNITVCSPKVVPTYKEKLDEYRELGYAEGTGSYKVQGEHAIYKSDSTLRRETSNDPVAEPQSEDTIKLNIIGGWRYRKGNQSITWEVEAPESGLYKIALRTWQSYGDGLSSYRQIAIDGEIPFEEMKAYSFDYGKKWRTELLADEDNEPYLFYLEEGTHELTMTVKMGPLQEVIDRFNSDTLLLSNIIKKIIMITGSEPDLNFDHELDKKIPGLMDGLAQISNSVTIQADKLVELSVQRPGIVNNFYVLRDQLNEMLEDPYIIPSKLNDLISAQNSLTSYLQDLQEAPLGIDYVMIASPDEEIKDYSSSFWQRLVASWKNFLRSFVKDYDTVATVHKDGEVIDQYTSIEVWVSRGKEWAELMKQMADEDFTPKTGIGINLNVLPAGQLGANGVNPLLLSIVSGKAPNVACGVAATSPVELAIREATTDLTVFDEYEEVKERFLPGTLVPFEYRGGVYALPETMDFMALFYRQDIIDELGIEIPNTWDDLYKNVLPLLSQNGMQFNYSNITEDVNTAGTSYLPFLYQKGGTFYTEDGLKSGLDSDSAYQAFLDWTKLYTVYDVPTRLNFYQGFRTGETPMGIGNYNLYMQISVAAPELYGRWGIAPMPGIEQPDGTINRTAGGLPTATMVLEQAGQTKESWEFIKWWTSQDVQARFGQEVESLIGIEARWNTANVEAYQDLPWNRADLAVMEQQWEWFNEQPIVLGSYFTNRHIKNAWSSVVMGDMIPRDALEKAVKDINKEMKLKQEEYGITGE